MDFDWVIWKQYQYIYFFDNEIILNIYASCSQPGRRSSPPPGPRCTAEWQRSSWTAKRTRATAGNTKTGTATDSEDDPGTQLPTCSYHKSIHLIHKYKNRGITPSSCPLFQNTSRTRRSRSPFVNSVLLSAASSCRIRRRFPVLCPSWPRSRTSE